MVEVIDRLRRVVGSLMPTRRSPEPNLIAETFSGCWDSGRCGNGNVSVVHFAITMITTANIQTANFSRMSYAHLIFEADYINSSCERPKVDFLGQQNRSSRLDHERNKKALTIHFREYWDTYLEAPKQCTSYSRQNVSKMKPLREV